MIGYRKTAICAFYLVVSMAGVWTGHVDGSDWLKYTAAIMGAFMGANIFDGVKK